MNARQRPTLLAASLLTLALPACAIPTTGLTDAKAVAETIGHVRPSKKDTCDTQQQIAAQSSRIDSIATNKEVVYKPEPCPNPQRVASNPETKR